MNRSQKLLAAKRTRDQLDQYLGLLQLELAGAYSDPAPLRCQLALVVLCECLLEKLENLTTCTQETNAYHERLEGYRYRIRQPPVEPNLPPRAKGVIKAKGALRVVQ